MMQDDAVPSAQSPSPSRNRRRFWLVFLLGAVILVCGVAIGSGGTILWIHHKFQRMNRDPEKMQAELAARIQSRLNLTDEQTARVEQILGKRHEAMMKVRSEVEPRFKAEMDGMRSDIAALLTAEQARQWNEEFDSIMMPGPPPHGDLPPHGPPPGK
jgi:hypothetical protein